MRASCFVVAILLGAALWLGGCTNSVYFYQRDAVSFTVEGRPSDPTAPMSANFGLKERVVLVVPPGDPDAAAGMHRKATGSADQGPKPVSRGETGVVLAGMLGQEAGANEQVKPSAPRVEQPVTERVEEDGHPKDLGARGQHGNGGPGQQGKASTQDCVSVISYFNFVKKPLNTNGTSNSFLIESAFITGGAARAVTNGAPTKGGGAQDTRDLTGEVTTAIAASGKPAAGSAWLANLSRFQQGLARMTDKKAVSLVADLDAWAKNVSQKYPAFQNYEWHPPVPAAGGNPAAPGVLEDKGSISPQPTFAGMVTYIDTIDVSAGQLRYWNDWKEQNPGATFQFQDAANGRRAAASATSELDAAALALKNQNELSDRVRSETANAEAVRAAVKYYVHVTYGL